MTTDKLAEIQASRVMTAGQLIGEYGNTDQAQGIDQVIARQMNGFHGRKDEGREGNLRTRGGLLYYT